MKITKGQTIKILSTGARHTLEYIRQMKSEKHYQFFPAKGEAAPGFTISEKQLEKLYTNNVFEILD